MMHCAETYTNRGADPNSSTNEEFYSRLKRLYPCVEDVTKLPHAWSTEFRAPQLGFTSDNLSCYFRGGRRGEEDEKAAAAVRTDNYIPHSCLLYYYEIKWISKGREGFMGLGLTPVNASLAKLPGWAPNSYGYHADDGHIYNNDGRGVPFGPTFSSDDVVGCGYNLVEGKCFFTKNGINLGKAFDNISGETLYYPIIGLKTTGEEIEANFGQHEFMYDIEQDLRSLRKNMTLTISDYPITDFANWQTNIHKLLQSWLLQNSYPRTAEAFSKARKLECFQDMRRLQIRNRIQALVLGGKISEAIKITNEICPTLLQDNPNLLFALKCRQFVELIEGGDSVYNNGTSHSLDIDQDRYAKLIQFGQELFEFSKRLYKLYGKNEHNEQLLQDAVGLIAFANPRESFLARLLDPSEREPVSQMLNNSILKAELGDSHKLPMEDVMNQLRTIVRLNDSHGSWLLDQLYLF